MSSIRNQALQDGGQSAPRSGQFAAGKPWYTLYRGLDVSWARSGLLCKFRPPPNAIHFWVHTEKQQILRGAEVRNLVGTATLRSEFVHPCINVS